MGRPKIIGKHLNVGLSEEMLDFVKKEAKLRGCTIVDVIRTGIYEMMEERRRSETRRYEAEIRYRELLIMKESEGE